MPQRPATRRPSRLPRRRHRRWWFCPQQPKARRLPRPARRIRPWHKTPARPIKPWHRRLHGRHGRGTEGRHGRGTKHGRRETSGPSVAGRPERPRGPTSYNTALPADWHDDLAAAIHQLEAQAQAAAAKSDAAVAQQAYLRVLYLLAGRRDDALSPIPDASPAAQDYWSKQLYGLAVWLDTDHTPDGVQRAAETKRILDEALMRLGESAPLVVHNLAFCTEVRSFGSITPFRKAEFTPDQEVVLYAELENYTVEPTPRGFHTALHSSYQVFDSRGQRIADQDFGGTEEYCQSPRHDFFIPYHLHLPKRIYNGKYTLQLTVEDVKSHKVGQSSIELTIKGSEG